MRRIALIASLLALASCRPDQVDLVYRFPQGETLTYLMTADAAASWNIGGSKGGGSYHLVLTVQEEVEEVGDEGALVRVTMKPLEVREKGLPSPGAAERSFALRAGANGEVLEVLEVGGVPARELHPDELAFIGTYRPPLPLEPVRLLDRWGSEQQVQLGRVFQKVVTLGRLEALGLFDGAPAAHLAYDGEGPLVWRTSLPQGDAKLDGSSATQTTATLDLDRGVLQRAVSVTEGRFKVRVLTRDKVPVRGTLDLTLRLDLRATPQ